MFLTRFGNLPNGEEPSFPAEAREATAASKELFKNFYVSRNLILNGVILFFPILPIVLEKRMYFSSVFAIASI
jgi:hypothetical protein